MTRDQAMVDPQTAPCIIPLARPFITQKEINAVVEVLQSTHLSLGPKLSEFEDIFARYCDRRHGIACSSGTAGLHLLIKAMGIGADDEVITTPFFVCRVSQLRIDGGCEPCLCRCGSENLEYRYVVDRGIDYKKNKSGFTGGCFRAGRGYESHP